MANFIGTDGFNWFVGVVEDRNDPTKTGRLRVRVLGHHTSNKIDLPTEDLPWAMAVLPTTSPGISGLGQSPSFIVEGSWVFGYFRDENFQEPVILGTLPGLPSETGNPNKGFYDPNRRSTDEDEADYELSVYPRNINEPDVNRLAVNDEEKPAASLVQRQAARLENIPTADVDAVGNVAASDTDTWSEPEISYKAVYPLNHVFESESGHIKEIDDTPGAERIHERHRTGTSTEMRPNGDLVTLVKNDNYSITGNNNKAYIAGDSDITIDGRHKIYINKNGQSNNNYDIQIGPNANINIQVDTGNINLVTKQGNINMEVANDYNVNVQGDYNLNVKGNKSENIEGNKTSNTTGAVIHRGQTIDLNP